jgi:tetratricopeptide (TPR) repeat protein
MVIAAALQIIWGRRLILSWGLLWFAAAHAPNTGILLPINALVSEHWMYLPTAGLFLGVAGCLENIKQKATIFFVLSLAALALGAKTYVQNRAWHDSVTYYESILAGGEDSGRAYVNLAKNYWMRDDFEKAIKYERRAIEHYSSYPPVRLSFMHFNLALMYLGINPGDENSAVTVDDVKRALPLSGRLPEVIDEMKAAHELNPDFYWINQFLSVVEDYQKKSNEEHGK